MDNTRPVSERVRPILHAMERSIDAARRRRLHLTEAPEPAPAQDVPAEQETTQPVDDTVPRLKARPKRSAVIPRYDGDLRSAG